MNEQKNPESDSHKKRALKESEAATYLGISPSFLRKSRMNGKRKNHIPPPPYVKWGTRTIRYYREDLDAWMDSFKSELRPCSNKNEVTCNGKDQR